MTDIDNALVAPAAVEKALAAALRRGGEFAEVFAEDKRSTGISLDDRRVEELSSGRDRGAGIRVVVGETTGFAHTADLSEAGLLAAAEAAAAVAPRREGRARDLARGPPRSLAERRHFLPRPDPKGREGRAAASCRRGGAIGWWSDRPGLGRLRRQSSTDNGGELRRPVELR